MDGRVNDQPVRILLDTGSYDSFIAGGTARRLNLRLRDSGSSTRGVNGMVREQVAVVDHLEVGNFRAGDLDLHVAGSKLGVDDDDFGLVLGADFFRHFTTEFDLAHAVVRLLKPKECKPEQLVYWDRSYFQMDLRRLGSTDAFLMTPVTVNGVRLRAQLDTGSDFSFITTIAAHQAGVNTTDPGVQPGSTVSGIARSPLPTWIGRFDSVTIGEETARNARLRIGDLFGANREQSTGTHIAVADNDTPDIILGDDFFRAHRVVVIPDDHTAVFTYNGGPVFQVARPEVDGNPTPTP